MKKLKYIIPCIIIIIFILVVKIINRNVEDNDYYTLNSSISFTYNYLNNGEIIQYNSNGELCIDNNNESTKVPVTPFENIEYIGYIGHYCVYNNDIYYVLDRNDEEFGIFKYDIKNKQTITIYEGKYEINNRINGISTNGKNIIIIFENNVSILNIKTQHIKRIINLNNNSSFSICGKNIFYTSEDGVINKYSLDTHKEERFEEIKAIVYIVIDNVIYYIDVDNDGRLSSYSLDNEEYKKYNTEYITYFEAQQDGIYAISAKEKTKLDTLK